MCTTCGCGQADVTVEGEGHHHHHHDEIVPVSSLPQIDYLFVDHDKDAYLTDLVRLEKEGLVRAGSTCVADNVVFARINDYLDYVRKLSADGCARTETVYGSIEYADDEDSDIDDDDEEDDDDDDDDSECDDDDSECGDDDDDDDDDDDEDEQSLFRDGIGTSFKLFCAGTMVPLASSGGAWISISTSALLFICFMR